MSRLTSRLTSLRPDHQLRECLAEGLGTFVLITFGCGSVAQSVLSHTDAGSFLTINFAWGIAVTLGAYVSIGVSGAHLNPAVTIALAAHGRIPWRKVAPYALSQLLGAFLASAVVFAVYVDALNAYDGGERVVTGPSRTAHIWATYPQDFLTIREGFSGQVLGTGLLVGNLFAITDAHNAGLPTVAIPAVAGLLVAVIGMSFGYNSGYAINPARDFGPRLFTYMAGWGSDVWVAGNHWWWVPIIAPIVGGLLGSFMYQVAVGWWTAASASASSAQRSAHSVDDSDNMRPTTRLNDC